MRARNYLPKNILIFFFFCTWSAIGGAPTVTYATRRAHMTFPYFPRSSNGRILVFIASFYFYSLFNTPVLRVPRSASTRLRARVHACTTRRGRRRTVWRTWRTARSRYIAATVFQSRLPRTLLAPAAHSPLERRKPASTAAADAARKMTYTRATGLVRAMSSQSFS